MIIEKKVGGPVWPPWPSGTDILRLHACFGGGRLAHVIFEEIIMSFWAQFDTHSYWATTASVVFCHSRRFECVTVCMCLAVWVWIIAPPLTDSERFFFFFFLQAFIKFCPWILQIFFNSTSRLLMFSILFLQVAHLLSQIMLINFTYKQTDD